jgi:hypothetical protein
MLLGVAVMLAAAAPAHATANGRADGYGNRCAMRGERLPTKHTLGANDAGNSLSRALLRKPRWGPDDPVEHRPEELAAH